MSEAEEPEETSGTERRGVHQSLRVSNKLDPLYPKHLSWASLNHVRGTQIQMHLVEQGEDKGVSDLVGEGNAMFWACSSPQSNAQSVEITGCWSTSLGEA